MTLRQLIHELGQDYLNEEQTFIFERALQIPLTRDEPCVDGELMIEGRLTNEEEIAAIKRRILRHLIQALFEERNSMTKPQAAKN